MIGRLLAVHRPVLRPITRSLPRASQRCGGTSTGSRTQQARARRPSEAADAKDPRESFLCPAFLALARKHNIGLAAEAKRHKPQSSKFRLDIKFSKRHTFHPWHTKFIEKQGHTLEAMQLAKYTQRLQVPLWWNALVTVDGSKAVVRSKSTQRAAYAFKMALIKNGYDRTGRKQAPQPKPDGFKGEWISPDRTAGAAELFGSVTLRVLEPREFLKLETSAVVAYLSTVVRQLEPLMGSDGQADARRRG